MIRLLLPLALFASPLVFCQELLPLKPIFEKARQQLVAAQSAAVNGPCSVPLLEMQIPADKTFNMPSMKPDAKFAQAMPMAKLPAPPCSTTAKSSSTPRKPLEIPDPPPAPRAPVEP